MSLLSPVLRTIFAAASPAGRRARLSILIFHRVLPEPDPLFPGETDARRFEEVCSWLAEWFNVLPLREAVHRLQASSLPPRAACITFDDGYADNYAQALPILRRHGLSAAFFIATSFLDGGRMWNDTLIESVRRTSTAALDLAALGLGTLPMLSIEDKRAALARLIPAVKHLEPRARADATAHVAALCGNGLPNDLMLTSEQLRGLFAAGMEIGAHSLTHPILARCDAATARREIADSRAHLEAVLGERIPFFAYPNGKLGADYTQEHARIVRDLGFSAALSTNPGAADHGSDTFQLPRFTPWDRSRARFGLRLAGNLLRRGAA